MTFACFHASDPGLSLFPRSSELATMEQLVAMHDTGVITAIDVFPVYTDRDDEVGWCRLTVSKPVLKAPMVSALQTPIS